MVYKTNRRPLLHEKKINFATYYKTMSNNLVLDTEAMSKYFFDKAELWGVTSSLSGFDLCHLMNVSMRLNLIRRLDFDLSYTFKTPQNSKSLNSLFDFPEEEKEFFPVYHQQMDLSESEIYVYSNKKNGKILIKEQKHIDFFILVKNAAYLEYLQSLDKHISSFHRIGWCSKINFEKEAWIKDLIL